MSFKKEQQLIDKLYTHFESIDSIAMLKTIINDIHFEEKIILYTCNRPLLEFMFPTIENLIREFYDLEIVIEDYVTIWD